MPRQNSGIILREIDGVWKFGFEASALRTLPEDTAMVLRFCDGETPCQEVEALLESEYSLQQHLDALDDLGLIELLRMPAVDLGAVATDMGDELLVYHFATGEASLLNPTAASIFRACGSRERIDEVCQNLTSDQPLARELLWMSLNQLQGKRLIVNRPLPDDITRRAFLSRWGKLAAALPVIVSVASPTPARAASCLADQATCPANPADCCGGKCGVQDNKCCSADIGQTCTIRDDCCDRTIVNCQGGKCCGTLPGLPCSVASDCCGSIFPLGCCGGTCGLSSCPPGVSGVGCCSGGTPGVCVAGIGCL